MKAQTVALAVILVLPALSLIPSAAAAATAVPGVQAIVTGADDPYFVEVKWLLSADDPNQDVGSYTYNLTSNQNAAGWVNQGTATTTGDGFQSVILEFSGGTAPLSTVFNVTVDDGTGPVDSCTVTVDITILGAYDSCGSLTITYDELYCFPREDSEATGFDVEKQIAVEGSELQFLAEVITGFAYGGKALAGDTASLEFAFELRARTDGQRSQALMLFSAVDQQPTQGSEGNMQTTGAFRDGISIGLTESGNDWDLVIYEHTDGIRLAKYSTTLTSGVDANTFTTGTFRVNAYSGLITVTLGSESHTISEATLGAAIPGIFYNFWVAEVGNSFQGAPRTHYTRGTGTGNFCINTAPATIGGGQGLIGDGDGQGLEDFDGEGGLGGTPMFPGIDVQQTQDGFGLSELEIAGLFAAILIMGLAWIGWMLAQTTGAGIGALVGIGVAAIFNLIALWIIVLLVLVATAVLVLGRRGGGSG